MPHPARPAHSIKSTVSILERVTLSHKARYHLARLLILLLLSLTTAGAHQGRAGGEPGADLRGQTGDDKSTPELKPGSPIKRDIKVGSLHVYKLELVAGQYVHLVVEQEGIDVFVRLYPPGGRRMTESNNVEGGSGQESLRMPVDVTGSYGVLVMPVLNQPLREGGYTLRVAELRAATSQDLTRTQAEALMREAEELDEQRPEVLMPYHKIPDSKLYLDLTYKVIEKYKAALHLWRQLGDAPRVADTLDLVGNMYDLLGDYYTALDYYGQSLQGWRAGADNSKQLLLLNKIGEAQTELGLYQDALDSYNRGIALAKLSDDPADTARLLAVIGNVFYRQGEFQKALEYYGQALPLWQAVRDLQGEQDTLNAIRRVNSARAAPPSGNVTGELELVLRTGHLNIINVVALSPDGRLVATGGEDHVVKLWETDGGVELRTLVRHDAGITSISFSPDGRLFASASQDGMVRLTETATGRQLRTLTGFDVWARPVLAFSPDGQTLAAGTSNKTLKLWDVNTGRELRTLVGHRSMVVAVAFSPDGRTIASGGWDGKVIIWDSKSGRELRALAGHASPVTAVAFTSAGERLVSGGMDQALKLWDVTKAEVVREFAGHTDHINGIAVSPDGKLLASVGGGWASDEAPGSGVISRKAPVDRGVRVWDIATGRQVRHLADDRAVLRAVTFTRDGRSLAAAGDQSMINLWDVATWEQGQGSFKNHVAEVNAVTFSAGGTFLATGGEDGVRLWDVQGDGEPRKFSAGATWPVAMSADGRLVAAEDGKGVSVWDAMTGRVLHTLDISLPKTIYPRLGITSITGLQSLVFSRNGKQLVLGGYRRKPMLFDLDSGKEPTPWADDTVDAAETSGAGVKYRTYAVAISPGGRFVVSAGTEVEPDHERRAVRETSVVTLWEVRTGREVFSVSGFRGQASSIAISPNNQWLAVGNGDTSLSILQLSTGQLERTLVGHAGGVNFVAFSPDGRWLAAAAGPEVKLWDVRTWSARDLRGHTDTVTSVSFTGDGNRLASGSEDGSTRIWQVDTGEEIAKLIALDGSDWAVITSEGRFNASDGAQRLMHYVYGLESITLEQLKEAYFEPGLLTKLMGCGKKCLRPIVPLLEVKLHPELIEQHIEPGTAKLVIKLKNRGGGIGAVRVLVNDKLAYEDARGAALRSDPYVPEATLTVDLSHSAYFRGRLCDDKGENCRVNKVTVISSNTLKELGGRGNINSRGAQLFWAATGQGEFALPTLYAIVAGVSDYGGVESASLDLRFAAKDAEDFAAALGVGARRLFCPREKPECLNKVQIKLLSTSGRSGTLPPTKENFRKAFEEVARQARPEDILVVYFAGHGVTLGANTDTYLYLTQEARTASREDLAKVYQTTAITSQELTEWLTQTQWRPGRRGIDALKQVLILDTCAAGTAGEQLALTSKRDLSADQVRAIEFLKDKTGVHILMASTADRPSYEASQYGQGLLTYTLLQGFSGAALDKGEFVDVQTLFRYAEKEVPKLAGGLGGVQKPVVKAPTGNTFFIGQMTEADKKLVPLAHAKPLMLRPRLGLGEENDDPLNLIMELRKRLDAESSYEVMRRRGKGQPILVYVDDDSFPKGVRVTGTYALEGETVRIKAFLRRDGKTIAAFPEVQGDKDSVVEKLLMAILEALAKSQSN